jgi:hypothetical protein
MKRLFESEMTRKCSSDQGRGKRSNQIGTGQCLQINFRSPPSFLGLPKEQKEMNLMLRFLLAALALAFEAKKRAEGGGANGIMIVSIICKI